MENMMLQEETQLYVCRLAIQIADDAARSDIETRCPSFTEDGREPTTSAEIRSAWYDISLAEDDAAELVRVAVGYLILRGRVERHPSRKSWIRVAG